MDKSRFVSSNHEPRRCGEVTKFICVFSLVMLLDRRGDIGISVFMHLNARKVCSGCLLLGCWLESSYKQEELSALIFIYLRFWCIEFGGDVGTLFLTIEEMHHGHCVGQLRVFLADRKEFNSWVVVSLRLRSSGICCRGYYYGLVLEVWGVLKILLSGEESIGVACRNVVYFMRNLVRLWFIDWSAYICGSVSLASCGLIGFAKGVLLVPTISGDADVTDLSLALPIFRYVLLLNQMKVTGDSCGESAVDVPMHYEFKGFFDTQTHVVLIDVGREYCLGNEIQGNRVLRLSRKVCSGCLLLGCWLESSYKQEELSALIFIYLRFWCIEFGGDVGTLFLTIEEMHHGHCVGQLRVFLADRKEFNSWVVVSLRLRSSGICCRGYYYGLVLEVWGVLKILLSGEESIGVACRNVVYFMRNLVRLWFIDWSAYICGSVSLASCGLIGFAKGVLLVPTISGDADVTDLSLALPIFRYVLLLNQMKVTGDSCGESAVDVPMHYEFKGFFDTQTHVVLIDVGRCWLMSWYDDNYSAFYGSKCLMRFNFGWVAFCYQWRGCMVLVRKLNSEQFFYDLNIRCWWGSRI
ncbi:hypothetical protein DY000_02020889 [Brassica cretica]|uniref:Uncharacterized protein n=1 Tax=Brassica cretica TaxID=69181 RepID=A0ABQ7EFJ3_BRACR|nr:hypothetical protein DY000_02020889 [Brassica cretica]